jgi:hypothetical protein
MHARQSGMKQPQGAAMKRELMLAALAGIALTDLCAIAAAAAMVLYAPAAPTTVIRQEASRASPAGPLQPAASTEPPPAGRPR